MRNCGQDMLPKMQPGFAIGNAVEISHRKGVWDSPSEMRLGFAARLTTEMAPSKDW